MVGRVRVSVATLPAVPATGRLPAAVLVDLLQGVVDEAAELGVALLQPDPIGLLGERLADQLERLRVLADQPQQDHVVGGHRLDLAVLEGLGAPEYVELGQVGVGVVGADVLGRGVDPVTEHTFLPARSSGPLMASRLPLATMMS